MQKSTVLLLAVLVVVTFGLTAMAEDLVQVGKFRRDAVDVIAIEKGFFKDENISVKVKRVKNSIELMRNLINEKFDVIHSNADNVISWAEGQGADPHPHDFVIFIGGFNGLRQRLVVLPSINGFEDLKGKVMAVDDPRTGYATVLAYILKQHGLSLNVDYTMKSFGNTDLRMEAMKRGDAYGGLGNLSSSRIKKLGFKLLARTEDYLPNYARGVGAARRDWATQHSDLLVRYTRALVRATNWVLDPANKGAAVKLLMPANKNSQRRAERMYARAVDPKLGFTTASRIDMEGIKTVIKLREAIGAMKEPLPPPQKYVDEQFYRKANATMTR